ncbi:cytidine deaminase [Janibacter hoylei]|uniref:cytidine deaminase n=1 Tax=Janibacter hoylei TaxID=364298 RepID=UPI0024931985|nr:cytidine deaminase [Janibacter hoylei]
MAAALSDADWERLRVAAVEAMGRAYAPYSSFPVGVAGLADDGRLLSGCNVENASYAVGLCAECGLVSDLVRTGGGLLVAVWCVDAHGDTLMPCGRCRQLLWEHGGPQCRIQTPEGERSLAEILPQAFGAHDLAKGAP